MALEKKRFAPILCRALETVLFSPSRAALTSGAQRWHQSHEWYAESPSAAGLCHQAPAWGVLGQTPFRNPYIKHLLVQCYWCLSRTFILKKARSISLVGLQTLTPHKKDAHAPLIWNASLIIFWYTFCSPLLTSQHCFNYGLGSNRQLLHHWNKNARKQPRRICKESSCSNGKWWNSAQRHGFSFTKISYHEL